MNRLTFDSQLVDLHVAASVVFHSLRGERLAGKRDQQSLEQLDTVAHALSSVATIWVQDGAGKSRELDSLDVLQGRFERGAKQLVTKDGRKFAGLAIARGDMVAALDILKAARISLP